MGYHPDKAVRQKLTTDEVEVVKRKIISEKVENSNNSGQANSVTPEISCQTTVQAVNTEQVKEAGQTGQEQVIEPDTPAVCCQERVFRTKIVSENRDSEEETTLEEHDDALVIEVSNVLVEELRKLIRLFSLEDVKKALAVAESDI